MTAGLITPEILTWVARAIHNLNVRDAPMVYDAIRDLVLRVQPQESVHVLWAIEAYLWILNEIEYAHHVNPALLASMVDMIAFRVNDLESRIPGFTPVDYDAAEHALAVMMAPADRVEPILREIWGMIDQSEKDSLLRQLRETPLIRNGHVIPTAIDSILNDGGN